MRVSALEKGSGGEPVKASEPKPTAKDDDDDSDFDPFASDDVSMRVSALEKGGGGEPVKASEP